MGQHTKPKGAERTRSTDRAPPNTENLEVLNRLLQSVRDVVWAGPVDGSIHLFMNEATQELYGRASAEFENNPSLWLEVVHPDDQERVRRKSKELPRLGTLEMEYRIIRPDGSIRWIRDKKHLVTDSRGSPAWIGGIAIDITDRKNEEEAFRAEHHTLETRFEERTRERDKAEERYKKLFENAGAPMYVIKTDGTIQALNPAWERVTGYAAKDWLGKSFVPLVHADDLARTEEALHQALTGTKSVTFEARYISASGEVRIAEHTLALQFDVRDRIEEVVGVARDLTEQKRAEQDRLRFEREIQKAKKLESLGLIAGGVAHDFNNLLVGVLGHADLALMNGTSDSSLRGHLDSIKTAAQQLSSLTHQMLAYAGRGKARFEPVDLGHIVDEMVNMLRASIPAHVTVQIQKDSENARLRGDVGQIRQVAMNLIGNAAEAIGETPGTVTVTTGSIELGGGDLRGTVLGSDLPNGTYSFIRVTDDGCGMRPEVMEQIFDPFYTTKFSGRGLGLAGVLGIVRAHRGGLVVNSEPERGSSFCVYLPHTSTEAPEADPETSEEIRGKGTILVVDDEAAVREVARAVLEAGGFAVVDVNSGGSALRILGDSTRPIDAILLDLEMPGMDGAAALAEVKRAWPRVPVILTSGYGEEEATRRAQAFPVAAFLQKPYDAQTLVSTVLRVLAE